MIHLVDTGPVVAFLNRRDTYHAWASDVLRRIPPPLHTCEAVIAEACHLAGPRPVLDLVERELLAISFRLDTDKTRIVELVKRYADQPMSFADACLVRMTELYPSCQLITLDGDFRVYRRNGRQRIPALMP